MLELLITLFILFLLSGVFFWLGKRASKKFYEDNQYNYTFLNFFNPFKLFNYMSNSSDGTAWFLLFYFSILSSVSVIILIINRF